MYELMANHILELSGEICMKSLLRLFIALMFIWGCAVQAAEQVEQQADNQQSEMTDQDSQGEKKSSAGGDESPKEEEEPECE